MAGFGVSGFETPNCLTREIISSMPEQKYVDAAKANSTELMYKLSEDDLRSVCEIGERNTLRVTAFVLCNFVNKTMF